MVKKDLVKLDMSLIVRKPVLGASNRSVTNPAVQSQKMPRGLKFLTWEAEEMFSLCSKNKCADQLGSYCTADLGLYFCICKKPVFS